MDFVLYRCDPVSFIFLEASVGYSTADHTSGDDVPLVNIQVAFTLMGIYLDEGCAYGIDLSESESHKAQVLCAMKDVAGTDMESHAVGLEDVFCHPSDDKYQVDSVQFLGPDHPNFYVHANICYFCCPTQSRVERRNQLQQLLSTVKDTTGQEDLIAYLRHELLKMTAKQLGATKV